MVEWTLASARSVGHRALAEGTMVLRSREGRLWFACRCQGDKLRQLDGWSLLSRQARFVPGEAHRCYAGIAEGTPLRHRHEGPSSLELRRTLVRERAGPGSREPQFTRAPTSRVPDDPAGWDAVY